MVVDDGAVAVEFKVAAVHQHVFEHLAGALDTRLCARNGNAEPLYQLRLLHSFVLDHV